MLYKVHSIILDAFAKCISVGLDGFINLKKISVVKFPITFDLSVTCVILMYTHHNTIIKVTKPTSYKETV